MGACSQKKHEIPQFTCGKMQQYQIPQTSSEWQPKRPYTSFPPSRSLSRLQKRAGFTASWNLLRLRSQGGSFTNRLLGRAYGQPTYPRHFQSSWPPHFASKSSPRRERPLCCTPRLERPVTKFSAMRCDPLPNIGSLECQAYRRAPGNEVRLESYVPTCMRSSTLVPHIFTPPS